LKGARLSYQWFTVAERIISLGQMDEHCFHLQIVNNMAFVHDPFSMDGPGESLLMDWGTPGANEKVREYVVRERPKDRVLHTFTFPVKRVSCAIKF
jgi:hypothetical protein